MPGQMYTPQEILEMTMEEASVAAANGYLKPLAQPEAVAQKRIGEAIFGDGYENPTSPPPSPQDAYAATEAAWSSGEYDLDLPSGNRCRLRQIPLEELAASGHLDKMTRLPGITQEIISKSEGQPPAKPVSLREQAEMLVEILNAVLPLVVVQPKVYAPPNPKDPVPAHRERVPGRVYVDSIPLPDKYAILNSVVGNVGKWDNFRPQP